MHEVEHRFDKRTTTETYQGNALLIGFIGTRGVPDCTVKEEHRTFRCGEPNFIGMVGSARRRFDPLQMDTRHMTRAAVLRREIVEQPETVSDQWETGQRLRHRSKHAIDMVATIRRARIDNIGSEGAERIIRTE